MLEKRYDFKDIEPGLQQKWEAENIYKFVDDGKKEIYSIDTPPPTVNGKIHIGHLSSYSHIDMVARYKRMNGFSVFYPFGFDDNGLPTERLVEKNLKKRAHEMPRSEFISECLHQTEELEKRFKVLFKKMAQSPDWDYEYSTISANSRKAAQMSFLDLYHKGRVYNSESPALWCTECCTSIAQAELESKELPSVFNYMKFQLENSDECLEIATTRPELLPACVCVFVHPEDTRFSAYVGKNIIVPLFGFAVPVIADELVQMDKGTGVVMCCTFGDQTDLEWYKKHKLPFKEAISSSGHMTELAGKYQGLYLLKARKAIIDDMREAGVLLRQEEIVHSVAVHERCGTPMEIMKKKQWFIDLMNYKEKFLQAGREIEWRPKPMQSRYMNWVENIQWDWCISRQRYFGVPFPVWYCEECGNEVVADISELPIDPNVTPKLNHKCSCGCETFVPETDVMDTWMTSSISPLINLKWFEPSEFKAHMLPMSLRPNAHDIIRTWDFYTIAKLIHHFDKIPWNNVMISGFVMANQKEKVSKSKDNSQMEPDHLLDTYSSDVTRYWTTGSSFGNDVVFSTDEFTKGKKLVNKLFNAAKFAQRFIDGFKPDSSIELTATDQWITALCNNAFKHYHRLMEGYELQQAMKTAERFFWLFCDIYIEAVKGRLYADENSNISLDEKRSGQQTVYNVLLLILKELAPFMPHVTEHIFLDMYAENENEKSIHLSQQTPIAAEVCDYQSAGDEFMDIIGLVRRAKTENMLQINAEIAECVIQVKNIDFMEKTSGDLCRMCGIEKLTIESGDTVAIINGVSYRKSAVADSAE